jgi:hypothetical protein
MSEALKALEDHLIARGCAKRNEAGQLVMLPIRVPFRYAMKA